jgi:hypothetical protein
MKQKIKLLLISIVFASYFACESDSNCGTNAADFVRFSIVTINEDGEEVASDSAYNFFFSTETVFDTVFFDIQNLNVLLSPAHDTLQYIFVGLDVDSLVDRIDTFSLAYRKISRVDSPDCPIDFSFTGLDIVSQTFDSTVIVNTTLTLQNNAPNIKFYTSF